MLNKSKYTTNASAVYVSDRMSGKMSGIPAISTSVLMNPICQARAKDPDSVCAHCFAMNTIMRYHSLEQHLEDNTKVLTTRVLELDELPRFAYSVGMGRFEAFGDLNNVTQAINYINIAKINPHVRFALWTKNPKLIELALQQVEKPANLMLIYSSPRLNECFEQAFELYPFIDKVFTVYDKATIEEQGIEINCGARSCGSCGLCYFDKSIRLVREQLK